MKTKSFFLLTLLVLFSVDLYSGSHSGSVEESRRYLKKNGMNPEKYVISKFDTYDYVFLGEPHWIKSDVEFVRGLIPALYRNGIRNLALESYEQSTQSFVDSMLMGGEWDETALYHTLSKNSRVEWGYKEYLDIFKTVWELNRTLKKGQPMFRLVLIGPEYYPGNQGMVDPDAFMADVLEREVISKGEKALVYCGAHHAFTSYQMPIYDFEEGVLYQLYDGRFGNIIQAKYPSKTFTIMMHMPWLSNEGFEVQRVRPVAGVIDSAMQLLSNKPVGFDVKGTFMGTLGSTDTYYAIGHENFKLEDFCDGYIFLVPYKEMRPVSISGNFYDDYNLDKLKKFMVASGVSQERIDSMTKEQLLETLVKDVNLGDLAN